jgi:hypothetical protein
MVTVIEDRCCRAGSMGTERARQIAREAAVYLRSVAGGATASGWLSCRDGTRRMLLVGLGAHDFLAAIEAVRLM